MNKKVAILLGSISDKHIADASIEYFEYFGIDMEILIMSAHRNPDQVAEFASTAREKGMVF